MKLLYWQLLVITLSLATIAIADTGTEDFIFLGTLTIASMVAIDAELTMWALFILPVLPFFADQLARKERNYHMRAQEKLSDFNEVSAQAVSTIRLQRLTQTGSRWTRRLDRYAADYRDRRLKVVHTSLLFILLMGICPLISYGSLLYLGIDRVGSGTMTAGEFVAFQTYVFLLQGPLAELGFLISEWQRSFGSLGRVTDTYRQPLEKGLTDKKAKPEVKETGLSVENLSFTFFDSDIPAFENISFDLPQGGRLGIKGKIGTGKSTLLSVLGGEELDFTGSLKLWGRDVRDYDHEELRQLVARVDQKPFLFADSIRRNVCLDQNFTDDEIWHVLECAGIAEDIRKFPDQLDTMLGEWGINLSGGQKQRMTLARAIARKPKLLLLDDCLSAVDTVTEDLILKALDREMRDVTLVWVAHRNSTLKYCDQVMELT